MLFSKGYIIDVGFITFHVDFKGVQVFIAFKICIYGIPYDWSSIPYRCSPYFSLISWNFKLHWIAQSSGFLLDYSTQGLRAVFIIHLLHPRQNSPFVYVTYGLPLNSSKSVGNRPFCPLSHKLILRL